MASRALLLAVVLAVLGHGVAASAESAFMLVSKTSKTKKLSESAEEITVSFSIYNTGSSMAYDVSLNDAVWPADQFEVVGNSTNTWDKLEGGSLVTHSLLLKPLVQGFFTPPPATVTFRLSSKPELQTAYSTPLGVLPLLQPEPKGAKWAWIKELGRQFGPLLSAIGIVILFCYIAFVPLSTKKSSKKRR